MAALRLVHNKNAPLDDDAIKELAKHNREAAASRIIEKYRRPLYHHAANILKDWEEGIDVVQEVFIKCMREDRFFDEDFKMKAWLYRVTSNLCFNMVRDRRRRNVILDGMDRPTSIEARQVDRVVGTEKQQQITEAMKGLSVNHREILTLRFYSDLSYGEIAEALDIKLGTVMSRLSRAKGQLLEVLRSVEGFES